MSGCLGCLCGACVVWLAVKGGLARWLAGSAGWWLTVVGWLAGCLTSRLVGSAAGW